MKGDTVVLMPHPAVLADLVERYETLRALHAEKATDPETRQRLDDVAYTLCVATGTRDVRSALAAARRQLDRTKPSDVTLMA